MSEHTPGDGQSKEPAVVSSEVPASKRSHRILGRVLTFALGGTSVVALNLVASSEPGPYPRFNCELAGQVEILSPTNDSEPDLYLNTRLVPPADSYTNMVRLGKDALGNVIRLPYGEVFGMVRAAEYRKLRESDAPSASSVPALKNGWLITVPHEAGIYAVYEAPNQSQGASDLCVAFQVDAGGNVTSISDPQGQLPGIKVPQDQLSLYTSFENS